MDKDEKTKDGSVDVAYQNKDISSKYFVEEFKDTFFKVFGLDLPDIVREEPTELPTIEVNDRAMDKLYYLADGSYAIVDFESVYSEENKVKYLGYVARLLKRVYNQSKIIPKLRVVIIYTADVEEGSTISELDMGDEKLVLTEAFLSNLDAESIIENCRQKIINEEKLSDSDKLSIMLCPMAVIGKKGKIEAIHRVIGMIADLDDDKVKMQILSGMLAFGDKVIAKEDVEKIRREIKMTKWEQLLYDETMEAVNKATNEQAYNIASNLLKEGLSPEMISRNTGLDISVVEELSRNLDKEKEKEAMSV
ncbi:MAG: hypothetical protein E7279_10955 [Lachnospiraceae bacterium]|nr:hypothetical protein [Lachnospiraceae bacterium]